MEGLVMTIAVFMAVYWIVDQLCPLPVRMVMKIAKRVLRGTTTLAWRLPARTWGMAMTLLGWSISIATLFTIMASAKSDRQIAVLAGLIWCWVLASWLIMRWWARHRFTAQPLPRRPRR